MNYRDYAEKIASYLYATAIKKISNPKDLIIDIFSEQINKDIGAYLPNNWIKDNALVLDLQQYVSLFPGVDDKSTTLLIKHITNHDSLLGFRIVFYPSYLPNVPLDKTDSNYLKSAAQKIAAFIYADGVLNTSEGCWATSGNKIEKEIPNLPNNWKKDKTFVEEITSNLCSYDGIATNNIEDYITEEDNDLIFDMDYYTNYICNDCESVQDDDVEME